MAKEVIGVDLGGTHLRTALIRNHKILFYQKRFTPKSKAALLSALEEDIAKLMTKNVKGIGVACPGPLKDGKILNTENIPLKYFDLEAHLRKKFRKKVKVANDANCVALAEAKCGVKKKNFIILTIGTGIGGGIIIDGKIYEGCGSAAEFGHLIIQDGKYLEDFVGVKGQHKLTKKYVGKICNMSELQKMDTIKSRKALEEFADYLGRGIASLINAFDPEIVVLKGGIKEAGKPLLDLIKRKTRPYVFLPKVPEIAWTEIEHPGTLGGSLLVS